MKDSKKIAVIISNDDANNRFIGSIQHEDFPIITVGATGEEALKNMELAVRVSCFIKNMESVERMLDKKVFDLAELEKESKECKVDLEPQKVA